VKRWCFIGVSAAFRGGVRDLFEINALARMDGGG
jgi:hypothetical protein